MQLVDSKQKILLLEKLLGSHEAFSVSGLSRLAELPKATVSVIVSDWEKAGLVLTHFEGRNKLTKINQKFYLLPELKKMFEKTKDFNSQLFKKVMANATLQNKKVKAVMVFGSRARNEHTSFSDLDLFVGMEKNDDNLSEKIMVSLVKLSLKEGVHFSPHFFSKSGIVERLKEHDHLMQNILNDGRILKGGEWIEHIQATS